MFLCEPSLVRNFWPSSEGLMSAGFSRFYYVCKHLFFFIFHTIQYVNGSLSRLKNNISFNFRISIFMCDYFSEIGRDSRNKFSEFVYRVFVESSRYTYGSRIEIKTLPKISWRVERIFYYFR